MDSTTGTEDVVITLKWFEFRANVVGRRFLLIKELIVSSYGVELIGVRRRWNLKREWVNTRPLSEANLDKIKGFTQYHRELVAAAREVRLEELLGRPTHRQHASHKELCTRPIHSAICV